MDARFNSGTTWPNTCSAAPQPQNDDGQPAGRPPMTRSPEALIVVAV
ncbi:hypothetical protein [Bradyrhizobium sp. RDM4]